MTDDREKTHQSHDSNQEKSGPESESNVRTTSVEKCSNKNVLPHCIHLGWLILVGILLIIVVGLIISTVTCFARVNSLQSELKLAQSKNYCQNGSNNESVDQSNTTERLNFSQIVHSVFTSSNYSYLMDVFYSNQKLLDLTGDCFIRGDFSLSQCINITLNLYGKHNYLPAQSCRELFKVMPNNSGYYWVPAFDGSIVQVYCDMTGTCGNVTGGLTRIATLNRNTRSQYCTGDISFNEEGCFKKWPMPGCSGFTFSPLNLNLSYSHICGTVEGNYFGYPDGFAGSERSSTTIDDNYVDGISLTYGNTSQRTHIWTFSACGGDCTARVPEFVGNHYSTLPNINSRSVLMFQRNFLPILNEDIEIRLCQDENRDASNEGIYLTSMNIYVN